MKQAMPLEIFSVVVNKNTDWPLPCTLGTRAEEERCLAEVDRIMSEWQTHAPVAGVIVEPIQVRCT
jgi:4-aminobutyrate aminotransferase-like enzyme